VQQIIFRIRGKSAVVMSHFFSLAQMKDLTYTYPTPSHFFSVLNVFGIKTCFKPARDSLLSNTAIVAPAGPKLGKPSHH